MTVFLRMELPFGQFDLHALGGFPAGLPAQEAPDRFDQEGAHASVA